jgi:hypothetical protein
MWQDTSFEPIKTRAVPHHESSRFERLHEVTWVRPVIRSLASKSSGETVIPSIRAFGCEGAEACLDAVLAEVAGNDLRSASGALWVAGFWTDFWGAMVATEGCAGRCAFDSTTGAEGRLEACAVVFAVGALGAAEARGAFRAGC